MRRFLNFLPDLQLYIIVAIGLALVVAAIQSVLP
jgi:hypothetical protein